MRLMPVSLVAAFTTLAFPVFAADTLTPPSPQKVVIVVLENHDYQQIVGDTANAPFLNSVISQGMLFTNAHATDHPSQANYLSLFSGSDQGVNSQNSTPTNTLNLNFLLQVLRAAIADPRTPPSQIAILQGQLAQVQGALAAGIDPKFPTGDAFPSSANFLPFQGKPVALPFTTPNLGSVLLQAGRTFTEYMEGLADAGAADAYGYAVVAKINNPADPYSVGYTHRHDAAANWISDTPTGNQLPRTVVQDFANFSPQNTDFSFLPNVSFVVPNTINDMHDGAVPFSTRNGDAWAKRNLANYLTWARTHKSLLIITTDESDTDKTNRIMTVVAGDPSLVRQGVSDQYLTHFDLLRSVETMFGTTYAGFSSEVYGMVFLNGQVAALTPGTQPPTVVSTTSGTVNGAQYQFLVPQNWNGQLVVYAHGYADPALPLSLPNTPTELETFQALTSQGFAVAMSSYSKNGWAVQEGTQETNSLRDLFAARVGRQPTRTYLAGVSMGGLITVNLAENFPGKYDGALSICGVVGGAAASFQRFGDGRVLFDYFFPGVIPTDLLHTPDQDYSIGSPAFNRIANALAAGFAVPGNPTMQFASTAGLTGSTPNELIFSAVSVLAGGYAEMLQRTQGKNFYDNTKTVYSGSANDAQLNAKVQRFQAVPEAVDYLTKYYAPTGKLTTPFMSLHTTEDPTVAFSQEASFASVVSKAGASNLLVQQSVDRYGHCNLKPAEIVNSFQGLVGWVNFGVRPNGGNITIP